MFGLKKRFLKFWTRWERTFNYTSLIGGFVVDLFLAKSPDNVLDNILLLFYLSLSAFLIVLINIRSARKPGLRPLLLIFILQFCFGGLAGNMLILYGKSGTFGGSLLFFCILTGFALGNEFLKTRYDQLRFNLAIYYYLLFTYCIISIPTFVVHQIGAWVFLLSGAVSLGIVALLLWAFHVFVFRKKEPHKTYEVSVLIGVIFGLYSGLYFLNIVPPVPLSVKSIGVYHSFTPLPAADAQEHLYTATYERPAWGVFWRDTSATYTITLGDSAYCYSAVFAPGKLTTPIAHRWEKYNPETNKWETQALTQFPISGGREEGYRGWSIEQGLTPGDWRCDVETGRGALIGRIAFTVVEGAPKLSTTKL
jgi:hypothetical protein